MVMMFVGGVVLIVDGPFRTIPTVGNLESGIISFLPESFCYHPNPNSALLGHICTSFFDKLHSSSTA
jgi:hypothetical protein